MGWVVESGFHPVVWAYLILAMSKPVLNSQKSSCFSLLSAEIMNIWQHAWLCLFFFFFFNLQNDSAPASITELVKAKWPQVPVPWSSRLPHRNRELDTINIHSKIGSWPQRSSRNVEKGCQGSTPSSACGQSHYAQTYGSRQ